MRGPDIAVLTHEPDSYSEQGGWVRGAPDVAIEILSPSDTWSIMQRKVLDYLEAGTERVWVVDPPGRSITVYRPDGSAALLRGQDTLEGDDVLPGFSLPLGDLFGG